MVPWKFKLMDREKWETLEVKLKPGEAPQERICVRDKGYLLQKVGIQDNIGTAEYRCILEVI